MAQTEKDLTNAISDFMDCSIVIPPTEIQDTAMLEPVINFQKKMLRDRVRPCDTRLAFGDRLKGQLTAHYNTRRPVFYTISFYGDHVLDQIKQVSI